MGWLGDVLGKFPSWGGVGRFIYVVTNYKTIAADIDAYRRQIKDREDWGERTLGQQDRLHQVVQERMQHELAMWQESAQKADAQSERALLQ